MELDRNQPSGNGLRAALTPWFDHPAARLVLLCAGFAGLALFAGSIAGATRSGLVTVLATAVATLAAIAVVRRAGRLPDLEPVRRVAWRWLSYGLAVQLAAMLAFIGAHYLELPALQAGVDILKFAFLPCVAIAAAAMLLSTRGKSFGPQFWLESLLVALCVGVVLWLVMPHEFAPVTLAPGAVPVRVSWPSVLDGIVIVLASVMLLRRSDWKGWPGLVIFALGLVSMASSRLLEAITFATDGTLKAICPFHAVGIVAFAVAAHFDYLRTERRAPPMDAAERGSPLASLMPYVALMLAGCTLLVLHSGNFGDPAGLTAWVVCVAAGLLFARQAIATGRAVALQTGLATRSAEARFSALIRNTNDVIAIVDSDGRINYLTPTAERIFGQPVPALTGRPLAELVAFEDRARLREFLRRDLGQNGASANVEARIPCGDDKYRSVEIRGTNMDAEPAIGGRLLNLRDMTDRKGMEEQLKRLAQHDSLTLLANRSLFRDRLEHAVAVSKRSGRSVAVMFVDLDNFKKINDSFGHAHGDRVLSRSAQRLVKATRNGDTVARLGGDEFAVLLENLTDRQQVVEIAARIVEVLQEPLDLPGTDARVAASVGIAFATAEDGAEELMRNADIAMYSSKAQGKGRYTVYEPAMQRAASKRQEIETELARALVEAQFLLHYQPIIELHSGYLLGVEALVRWKHPKRGLLWPAEFIGVAEETGQMVQLGRWVLAQACREVKVWQARLPEGRQVRVGVNVSAVQLTQSDICADVAKALEISGIEPGCLVIELTESVLMQNTDDVFTKLTQLKKQGVRIAIDDFGTGYSSLSYLHRFPIDILKIDRSFVEQLGKTDGGAGLARSIITLGQTLGLEVVAEGIELEHQQLELIELGCVAGQGYFYSKPAMLHELEYSIHMMRRRTLVDTLPMGASFTATGRFVVDKRDASDLGFAATGTFGRETLPKSN
jgi:diguanylate cyclase (GGDEF)-like protein/PAS domain S-box-containing protein